MATDATIVELNAAATLGAVILGASASAPVGMTCLDYMAPEKIEFWGSKTNNRATATKIGTVLAANGVLPHKGLGANETWYYWARAVDSEANLGAYYPVSATAGVTATTLTAAPGANSVGPTELQNNAVTTTKIANASITTAKVGNAQITDAHITNLSANKITAGIISALIEILGPKITGGLIQTKATAPRIVLDSSNNSLAVYNALGQIIFIVGGGISAGDLGSAAEFRNYDNTECMRTTATVNGTNAHGLRGRNSATGGGHGIVGVSQAGGGYAVFAQTGPYGPFTGAHDALLPKGSIAVPGDIIVDRRVLARDGIDNALTEIALADQVGQRGVVGVISKRTPFDPDTHLSGLPYSDNDVPATFIKKHFASKFDRCTINGVGEGQVNVCGRGGNFALGDLIIASDLPGKGQRQSDDIVRSYTVARIREAVTFDHPDQVKLVACIYLAG